MNSLTDNRSDPWLELIRTEDEGEFFAIWLDCLATACGGVSQAVVVWGEEANVGPFRPAATWPEQARPTAGLADLCERVLELRLPLEQATPNAVLAYPILFGSDIHGVVALGFSGAMPRQARDWLRWGLGWIRERIARRESSTVESLRERLFVMLDLLTQVVDETKFVAAAQAVVTAAAQRLDCERVSFGLGNGKSMRLLALSHSADFSRRIDLIQAIESAMNEAADQGQTVWLGSDVDEGVDAFVLIREHERLRRDFDTEEILSIPFKTDAESGVFVFEWPKGPVDTETRRLAESVAPLLGRALADRRQQDRSWPVRMFHSFGDGLMKLVGPRHGQRKLVALTLISVVAFLFFAKGEFRVAAPSMLEGGVRRMVVAPFDGFIASSQVRAGHVVGLNTVLATLDDRDLRLENLRWESQQTQYSKQAHEAQAQRNLAQLQISLAQSRQADAQRQLSRNMLDRSKILAPFAGVIVAGDLSQQLGAAVKKGQTLFEIAPLDSYRVILDVEEADIPHLEVGKQGRVVLAAFPDESLPFTVSLVTSVAHAKDGKNYFRVEATLDQSMARLRPGMEGVGKVDIGERQLVWIWTRHFVDWLRLQAWIWAGI